MSHNLRRALSATTNGAARAHRLSTYCPPRRRRARSVCSRRALPTNTCCHLVGDWSVALRLSQQLLWQAQPPPSSPRGALCNRTLRHRRFSAVWRTLSSTVPPATRALRLAMQAVASLGSQRSLTLISAQRRTAPLCRERIVCDTAPRTADARSHCASPPHQAVNARTRSHPHAHNATPRAVCRDVEARMLATSTLNAYANAAFYVPMLNIRDGIRSDSVSMRNNAATVFGYGEQHVNM